MKTVKFKDLPENVKEFLKREYINIIEPPYSEYSEIKLDWLHNLSVWPEATDEERLAYAEWKYPKGTRYVAVEVSCIAASGELCVSEYKAFTNELEPEGSVVEVGRGYIYSDKTGWAEIISEPEKEEPTFKAGDEVIVWHGNTVYKVIHVFDGMAWIKNADQKYGSLVLLSDLRKYEPDPDKVYREMAKEIMKDKKVNGDWVNTLESMLIEALKKGKEL